MRAARLLLAFAAGLFLYQAAVVFVGGFLSAVAVPKAYFDWFGRSNLELSLALLQFFGFALPIAVLVAGGTLSVLRILGRDAKATLWAVLAGLVVCFVFWLSTGMFALPPDPSIEHYPPLVLLRQALFPPWWAAPGLLAPWLGFAFAAWLALRAKAK
jgi:hypothetical protein